MTKFGEWEVIEKLGGGGQSDVYKVRTPSRASERTIILNELQTLMDQARLELLATHMYTYARPDEPHELAALKAFKIPASGPEHNLSLGRLENEIAVLSQNLPGMLKLLAANKEEQWIVTELMRGGTFEDHPETFKGDAYRALKAFRSLVNTVTNLHAEKKVHRDIKPANVFIADGGRLVLGDFGIVFVPDRERLTLTHERVGPRDYMPQWANLGERHENVEPNFDIYMLAKLLWCMASGRLKLPREWHKRPAFDLSTLFPNDEGMPLVNSILDKCLVEEPENCLPSATELLAIVDESLALMESGGQLLTSARRCRICGKGHYEGDGSQTNMERLDSHSRPIGGIVMEMFICNFCGHFEFFAPGYPEKAVKLDEGMKRQMKKPS